MASIYRRGKTYYVKFYENGRRVRRSLGVTKRSEALKIKEQIERDLANGKFQVETKDTRVDVFWPAYLSWAQQHKSSKTIENETLFWRQFTEFAKPKMLGDVTPRDIERFKAKRRKDGLQPRSINDALRFLQVIFSYAKKLGYFSGPNPVKGIQRYKLQKNPPRFLSKGEIEKVLTIAKQHGRNIHLVFALGWVLLVAFRTSCQPDRANLGIADSLREDPPDFVRRLCKSRM